MFLVKPMNIFQTTKHYQLKSCTSMRKWVNDHLLIMINCDLNINNLLETNSFSAFG